MIVDVWVYRSVQTSQLSDDELHNILSVSREQNKLHHITGMLLYWEGNFTQIIEGGAADILALQANIQRDPRHTQVTTLYQGQNHQIFANWSMAFQRLDKQQQIQLESYMPLGWAIRTLNTTAAGKEISQVLGQMSEWAAGGGMHLSGQPPASLI